MEQITFDIAIIGGGHAGLEAAYVSSSLVDQVCLITLPGVPIASAPCNPAVGGVGKSQLVREIDLMGGLMGKLADLSGIQYRTLNESKGYAVQSTRIQIDKDLYAQNAETIVAKKSNLKIIRSKVGSVTSHNKSFKISIEGQIIIAKKVIVTTGTFLNGVMHFGAEKIEGGRYESTSSASLGSIFNFVKTLDKRFKTGTPPRLLKSSINFGKMIEQKSDENAYNLHCLHQPHKRFVDQVSCFITHTNEKTLSIIRANKEKSPMYNGQITGTGPRYCPSIEDKAFRYPDRHRHHVFVEPEGLNLETFYPNGISTSLPIDVQLDFIKTIEGLEDAIIEIPGYAVEYDVVDTAKLDSALEYRDVPGLYFAGQVNGTSGYEEAAGQGLVAGINASLSLNKREKLVFDRQNSYLGVLIEDLITSKRDEPYRLFTARAENRLYIREDNVLSRIKPYREKLGLKIDLDRHLEMFHVEQELLSEFCLKTSYLPADSSLEHLKINFKGRNQKMKLSEMLTLSSIDPVAFLQDECSRHGIKANPENLRTTAISMKYKPYIDRMDLQNNRLTKLSKKTLDLEKILKLNNISYECKQRISDIRPENFGQLMKIDGMRMASVTAIASTL